MFLTRNRQVPLQEGVCIFAVSVVLHICCFVCSRAQKGVCDGGGQGVCRLLSAMAVVKAPPRGTGVHVCEIIASHVIMFLLFS